MPQATAAEPIEGTAILGDMSGRYAFSLPEPRDRDGWFKIGSIDVTTTAFVVGLSLISMVLYAFSPELCMKGAFNTAAVRDGELWRLFTWPITNPPLSIFVLIEFLVFWYFGNIVEEQVGRKPFAVILTAMAVVPAVVVTLFNVSNDFSNTRWWAFSFSLSMFTLVMIAIFGVDNPNAKFLFGIPAWVIAAAFVFIEVLQDVGARAWGELMLGAVAMAVGFFGARQRGMLDTLTWMPVVKRLAGPTRSPYGEIGSARPKAKRFGRGKSKSPKSSSPKGSVVTGPWAPQGGPTPLEQAELDVLLDRISAGGIDSLTKYEKDRLNELSKRMRES